MIRSEPLLALVGPTATGKTGASIVLAESIGAEILCVDSMLVYRGMDIGTAKPTPAERARTPHHLLDLVEPSEPFSVARYQREGRSALATIGARGGRALMVGGSGLYFRALVDDLAFPGTDPATRADLQRQAAALGVGRLYRRLADLDPIAAARIEPANVRRIVRALEVPAITGRPFSAFAERWEHYPAAGVRVAGLTMARELLITRIRERVGAMLEAGWALETQALVDGGSGAWLTSTQAIGYAELARHLAGGCSLQETIDRIVTRTKNLARRQLAWFRRDPRIRWFEAGPEGAVSVVEDVRAYLEAG